MNTPHKPATTATIVPDMVLRKEAPDTVQLFDLVETVAGNMNPDRIMAIRLDETNFCAELDIAARPVSSYTLH